MGRRKARIADLVFKFYESYRQLWGERYEERSSTRLSGSLSTKIKELISDIGFSESLSRLERYFENDDDWLLEKHHPIHVFIATADNYLAKKGKKNGKGKKIQRKNFDVASELRKCQ